MTVWLIARGAGLSALVLLTVSTCLGALVSGGVRFGPQSRVVAQYAHRVTASVGLAVLGLHLTMILTDSLATVGWVAALVPFTSAYRPLWVGLGSLAAYTVLLVAGSGFVRGRLAGSARAAGLWRATHGAAYAGWALAMLHGLKSGTDSGLSWVRWLYVLCLGAVLASVAARAVLRPSATRVAVHAAVTR